jgi:hypothetical protein
MKKPQLHKLQLDVAEWTSPLKAKGVLAESPMGASEGKLVQSKKVLF